eukprot:scpid57404/ scgid22175/ Ras-related protein Rap-1b
MKECRVVLMGCGGVGKSALAIRFATGEFVASYDPTIEDFYRHPIAVDGLGTVSMEILDTAGTGQHYNNNRHLYITSGHVFALVYSVASRESLDSLQEIYRDVVRLRRSSGTPIIIVGTKCDVGLEQRQVAVDDVRQLVRKSWGVSRRNVPIVMETSAKEGKNVNELFGHMARLSLVAMVRTLATRSKSMPQPLGTSEKQSKRNSAPVGGLAAMASPRHSLLSTGPSTALLGLGTLSPPASRGGTLTANHVGSPGTSKTHTLRSTRSTRSTWQKTLCTIL